VHVSAITPSRKGLRSLIDVRVKALSFCHIIALSIRKGISMAIRNYGEAVHQRTGATVKSARHITLGGRLCVTGRRHLPGITLIEVMIAMLVISVGVLGVTGMQLVSMHQNQSAMLRTVALMLGNDIIDRMLANPAIDYSPVTFDSTPLSAVNCIKNVCSPTQMAEYDVAVWKCSINSILDPLMNTPHQVCGEFGVAGSLPEGVGSIEKTGTVYRVTVQWLDDRSGSQRDIALRAQIRGA
jgi:type IV pilus assembly protein PilV